MWQSTACKVADLTRFQQLLVYYFEISSSWSRVLIKYGSVPALYAPVIAQATALFAPLFVVGAVFFHTHGFRGPAKWEMASALPSFFHGVVSFLVCFELTAQHLCQYGHIFPATPNTASDIFLLQFSAAYFLADTLVYILLFARHELLFALHHVVVTGYMLACLRMGRGAVMPEVSIVAGEVTSPLQNLWFWLKNMRYVMPWADVLFAYVSWLYSFLYVLVRSGIGIPVMGYLMHRIWQSQEFPVWQRAVFLFCLSGGVVGSQLWSIKISKRLLTKYRPAYGTKPAHVGASPIAINPPLVQSVNGVDHVKED